MRNSPAEMGAGIILKRKDCLRAVWAAAPYRKACAAQEEAGKKKQGGALPRIACKAFEAAAPDRSIRAIWPAIAAGAAAGRRFRRRRERSGGRVLSAGFLRAGRDTGEAGWNRP